MKMPWHTIRHVEVRPEISEGWSETLPLVLQLPCKEGQDWQKKTLGKKKKRMFNHIQLVILR